MLDPGASGLTVCSGRGYHEFTHSQNEVGFRQICVTISKVSPIMCENSCQIFLTISVFLCSKLLSFCQIFVTITKIIEYIGPAIIHIGPILSHIFGRMKPAQMSFDSEGQYPLE